MGIIDRILKPIVEYHNRREAARRKAAGIAKRVQTRAATMAQRKEQSK